MQPAHYLAWLDGLQFGLVLGMGVGGLAVAFGIYAFTSAFKDW